MKILRMSILTQKVPIYGKRLPKRSISLLVVIANMVAYQLNWFEPKCRYQPLSPPWICSFSSVSKQGKCLSSQLRQSGEEKE